MNVEAMDKNEHDPLLEIDDRDSNLGDSNCQSSTSLLDQLRHVIKTYWFFGLVAFGGPAASVSMFRDHLVVRKGLVDDDSFTELFSLSQALPGPSATQLLVATAILQAGPLCGILVFFLWILPGFSVLTMVGVYLHSATSRTNFHHVPGVAPAAVALICQACYGFLQKLDSLGIVVAMISCAVAVLITGDEHVPPTSSQYIYPMLLILGGLTTFLEWRLSLRVNQDNDDESNNTIVEVRNSKQDIVATAFSHDRRLTPEHVGIPLWAGILCFVFWAVTFAIVMMVQTTSLNPFLQLFGVCFRIGSILFGGGIVVVPMLQTQVVPLIMSDHEFLSGLGLAQSLPGPLSNLTAYIGAVYQGILGAIVAEIALFLPGMLLLYAMLPFWYSLRQRDWFRAVLSGLNAAAIGIIASACVVLFEKGAVESAADAAIFMVMGGLLAFYKVAAPIIIVLGAVIGIILYLFNIGQVPYHD